MKQRRGPCDMTESATISCSDWILSPSAKAVLLAPS